jgi:hypothetical protein
MADAPASHLDDFFEQINPAITPEPVAAPETVQEIAPAVATPEVQTEQEEAVPEPKAGERVVPLSALEAERGKRKDWKEQATRLEEQHKAAIARADAAEKRAQELEARHVAAAPPTPPQAAPAPQQVTLPNPVEDPAGYAAAVRQQLAAEAFNERLNLSEQQYAESNPGTDTKAIAARFAQEAAKNPQLASQLRIQPHPYDWAAKQLARIDAVASIGDPLTYREKLEAEIRAQIAAEASGQVVPQPAAPATPRPTPVLPASLATVRNAAPGAAAPSVSEDMLDAIVPKR